MSLWDNLRIWRLAVISILGLIFVRLELNWTKCRNYTTRMIDRGCLCNVSLYKYAAPMLLIKLRSIVIFVGLNENYKTKPRSGDIY